MCEGEGEGEVEWTAGGSWTSKEALTSCVESGKTCANTSILARQSIMGLWGGVWTSQEATCAPARHFDGECECEGVRV